MMYTCGKFPENRENPSAVELTVEVDMTQECWDDFIQEARAGQYTNSHLQFVQKP